MSSIALDTGFFWRTLWDAGENASLKQQRKDPNILLPGDTVFIPDLQTKTVNRPTEKRHVFRRKGVPAMLRLQLLDARHEPRANLPYTLSLPNILRKGSTDGQGYVIEPIPPDAPTAVLEIRSDAKIERYTLKLGNTNPIDDLSGVKQRLRNLGYSVSSESSDVDDATQSALKLFQGKYNLPTTGNPDDATRSQLQKVHGS